MLKNPVSLDPADAYAAPVAATMAVSGTCSDTPVTAFSPNFDSTIVIAAPVASTGPSCTATMAISGSVVNGDTAPGVNCSILTDSGFITVYSRTPTMKLGGLLCVTEDRARLEVHGDGSDNLNMDIAISTVSATAWDGNKKVDAATSAAKIMLFGTNGQVDANPIIDGSDNDATINGEVAFGGTVTSQGGSRTFIKADATNYDLNATTDRETLTFTFTSQ